MVENGTDGEVRSDGIGTPKSKVFDIPGRSPGKVVTKRQVKLKEGVKRISPRSEEGQHIAAKALARAPARPATPPAPDGWEKLATLMIEASGGLRKKLKRKRPKNARTKP